MRRNNSGFSLVELAIVLVILGLLVGGVLAGQSLIRASELRSHLNDLQRYNTAFYGFRDKYFGLPGDLTTATQFWGSAGGAAHTNDATCDAALSASSVATCNGNGNNFVDSSVLTIVNTERYYAWKDLANAGLIAGAYSGHAETPTHSPGVNVPISKISNLVSEFVAFPTALTNDPLYYDGTYGFNAIIYYLNSNASALFKPEEAWNFDIKLDDGKPATGRIFTYKPIVVGTPDCATTSVTATAEYNLTSSNKTCQQFQALP